MRAVRLTAVTAVATAATLASVTGCTEKSDAKDSDAIKVTAADTRCDTSTKTTNAGQVTLAIENKGSKATEVEVLFPDNRIVSEKENIGPGTSYTLTAEIKPGVYLIACRPGMKGEGVRQKLTVTGGGESVQRANPQADKAVAAYRGYAEEQAEETLPKVKVFTDAIKKGDLEAAKQAYAPSRVGWERTEPVAESFGDIDPKVDTRADGLEDGQEWTGWHRLEKALWQDKKIGPAERTLADQLVEDLTEWEERVGEAEITPTSMANGAKELLDEVATGKVTGEEDRYSHTDLVDFKANVEGAQQAYELLKPMAARNDPALTKELDKQFTALNELLDTYRTGAPESFEFKPYDQVGAADRKQLSDAVNALAEPLSKLAAAVSAG